MHNPFHFDRLGLAYWQGEQLMLELDGQRYHVRCGAGALGYHAQRSGFKVMSMDSLRPGRRPLCAKDWVKVAHGHARGLLDAQKNAFYSPPQAVAA